MKNIHTLQEAKEHLRENWEKGTKCPACGQNVKLYKRPLYGTIAVELIRLYRLDQSKFHHITEFSNKNRSGGGDFAKLLFWDMVEEEPKSEDKNTRTSGMWRITQKGIDFVNKQRIIHSHALVYDGKFLGYGGTEVNIVDVLGKKFDYEELMS